MCRTVLVLSLLCGVASWSSAALREAGPSRERSPRTRGQPPESARLDAALVDAQVRLDRAGFSPGEIDGMLGRNTTLTLAAYQRAHNLRNSGLLDDVTREALSGVDAAATLSGYTITQDDVDGPWTPPIPQDPEQQAALPALGYTSPLEMLGERFHASPALLRWLNPSASFTAAGEVLRVPAVLPAPPVGSDNQATDGEANVTVRVSRADSLLTVAGADGHTVFSAPVTVGSEHDPLPLGRWAVTVIQHNPVFNYNPDLFWDADPSTAKVRLPAGPNSPVGVIWIGITREHYGLHGTAEPSHIGHTESHGCVRLTNWDAERLAALVRRGTPVLFEE